MQEVGFADDADNIFVVVDHRQRADVVIGQKPHGVGNVITRADGDDVANHDVHRFHTKSPVARVFGAIDYGSRLPLRSLRWGPTKQRPLALQLCDGFRGACCCRN